MLKYNLQAQTFIKCNCTENVTDKKSAGVFLDVIRCFYVGVDTWSSASLRYVDIIMRTSIGRLQTINILPANDHSLDNLVLTDLTS